MMIAFSPYSFSSLTAFMYVFYLHLWMRKHCEVTVYEFDMGEEKKPNQNKTKQNNSQQTLSFLLLIQLLIN